MNRKIAMNAQLNSNEVNRLTGMKRWEKRELIRGLRGKGLSYREIIKDSPFSISKSTVSAWCKDIELTELQKDRLDRLFKDGSYRGRLLGPKTTQLRRAKEVAEIKEKAKSEIHSLTENEFKTAGLMLYWAEGNKKNHVGVCNSDPELIRFMMKWLRLICGVSDSRLKPYLNIHSGQDEAKIKQFWSRITGLPISQFGKSYIKKEGTGHRKNVLYNGTIKIEVCDKNLLYKILGWIEGVAKDRAISSSGRASAS